MSKASSGKEVASTDTKVETKVVPNGENSVQRITITTTKTIYTDGSSSTSTETETLTETKIETRTSRASEIKIISDSAAGRNIQRSSSNSAIAENSDSCSSSSSESSDDDDEDFSAFQRQALRAHNRYRKNHGAPALSLSKKICETAQNWANTIAAKGQLAHSKGSGYGENVCFLSGDLSKGRIPVEIWYNEVKNYKFGNVNGYQPNTGHFSQVVWKESTELGIGKALGGGGTFIVANYNPPGNYEGHYLKNVSPPI